MKSFHIVPCQQQFEMSRNWYCYNFEQTLQFQTMKSFGIHSAFRIQVFVPNPDTDFESLQF